MPDMLRAECLTCLLGKYLNRYPEDATNEQRIRYIKEACIEIANASTELAAPVIVRNINNVHEKIFGNRIDYAAIKPYYNNLMLGFEKDIENKISNSKDQLLLALKYALVGNYIDFGAMKSIDEEYLLSELANAETKELDMDVYNLFSKDLQKAKRLVYLTDNCGEIVLDKILIKEIKKLYPDLLINVIVRGGNVLNDATVQDATQIGLDQYVNVIGNGNNIAGTWEKELSKDALCILDDADVILSKGQANFETLHKSGRGVYFLFLCKCDMFAKDFGVDKLTGMFIKR